ncbi:MAG: cytochrome c biogenesis protein ResB [Hydrogenophaga sp.]|uniref:cytochrome c biogenesis protein ResB n=1 Tax=Hydrogenophaga sp. TaxID=1904254 RepID=UPI002727197E|nr:cytochrome c biogenesis protein ResB [Hydrogenophaga sp.]MDO9505667.1 cytochrome c biogenesis protein ResB [Hydrogenophaga sp.]MDP1781228.1 cytochrome c biogenesis protein ResB [Hydrogenophaga sp.]MDP2075809.1 cytochrome c biogenesis protein ResB [Hydrogenophaga sp.]MDP2248994.1 cytochrome c biogenesis protein ResB [Hydrogenophaga sp.]MDP2988128.1 cytochrome c biogenesis protein ResB [Hydrogenophaga sp.]
MTVSTQGLHIRTGSRIVSETVELLSSMRFSISLLTVICIASVIGTVIKQHEPFNNYVNQFGPFWADVFASANLYSVYSAWWFLLILAFLVVSTSLCIARNTPKILADFKVYKENIREQSLKAFPHRAESALGESAQAAANRIGQTLLGSGWKVKLQSRDTPHGQGWMVAAKTGAANKIGYIAAHSAIVLVCIGGLLDGDLMVRAQTWFNGKSAFTGGGLIADVPTQHRLSSSNPTFRANLLVTEGTTASTAILAQPTGVLLQDLPFSVELKKFIVEYYDTGMPKLFASDIVITDFETGEKKEARVEVNHPASHRGINIYQSSFDDGGSRVKLQAVPLNRPTRPFEIEGTIGSSSELSNGDDKLVLEYTGLRTINVENFAGVNPTAGVDVRKVDLRSSIESRLGSGHKTVTEKTLRNVGPSITYKLRDAAGQAVEYHNYMLPMDIEGARVYLLGLRDTPSEAFRYLRIPVDEKDSMDGFVRLRAALDDPQMRELAVRRYAVSAVEDGRPELAEALMASATRALALFAGAEPSLQVTPVVNGSTTNPPVLGGLQAVSTFLENNVPQAERERASEVLVRILNGTLFELLQVSRERADLPPLERNDATQQFMTQAVISLSDTFFYPAPMTFQLKDFTHVQASVFQVARAPGQNIVYLGCLLLIVGIFAMLYVRERRLWVWLAPSAEQSSMATMALSSNRKTMEVDREFDLLKTQLLKVPA